MIDRRLLLRAALPLGMVPLAACSNLLGPPDAGQIYVVRPAFGPPPAGGAKVAWSLAVMRPDVPGGLDSDRIALIQPGGTMDYYAGATYPDRLPATLQRTLVDGFEASGRIDAVAREDDALHADYNILVEVKHFEAQYAVADGVPDAQVTLVAKLSTAHGRVILASATFAQTQSAGVNSTAAAARALQEALGAAVTKLVAWTLDTAPPAPPVGAAAPGKPAEQLLHEMTRPRPAKAPPP